MKLDLSFTVVARCSLTFKENGDVDTSDKDITLKFTMDSAENFLSRFSTMYIDLDDNIRIMFMNNTNGLSVRGILVMKDGESYLVKNHEQIIRDVREGFLKLHTLDKISTILDFDFEEGLSFQTEKE